MHARGWCTNDVQANDVQACAPDLVGLLAVPAPREQVVARDEVGRELRGGPGSTNEKRNTRSTHGPPNRYPDQSTRHGEHHPKNPRKTPKTSPKDILRDGERGPLSELKDPNIETRSNELEVTFPQNEGMIERKGRGAFSISRNFAHLHLVHDVRPNHRLGAARPKRPEKAAVNTVISAPYRPIPAARTGDGGALRLYMPTEIQLNAVKTVKIGAEKRAYMS